MCDFTPLVSVFMITYNHEEYIEQAIESVMMQEVSFSIEIVIGDDCSSDKTQNILLQYKKEHPDIINLILREKNIGPANNLFDVFMNCKGKYIAILEGDDYWTDKHKLSKQVKAIEGSAYSGICHKVSIFEGGEKVGVIPNDIDKEEYSLTDFLDGKNIATQSLLFRNIFPNNVRIWEIERLLKCNGYVCDFQLCCLILSYGNVKLLDSEMSVYRHVVKQGKSNYNSFRKTIDVCNDHISLLNAVNIYFHFNYNLKIEKIKYHYEFIKLVQGIKNRNIPLVFRTFFLELKFKDRILFIRTCFDKLRNKDKINFK